jgi:ribonuclease BN (tRNA processing enzyme)
MFLSHAGTANARKGTNDMLMLRSAIASLLAVLAMSSSAYAQSCTGSPVSVQILGSNGPGFNRDRVSAGYLLWTGSQAKMIVDMGGGTYARYTQTGAKFNDLSIMAISHFHPDHTSDLPAFMWAGRQGRSDVLPVIGPSGNEGVPALPVFLKRLFDSKEGAFQVLGAIMEPASVNTGVLHLEASTVDVTKTEPTKVLDKDGMLVTAIGIPHGNIPALAYRVQTNGVSVVFSTDQTGTNPHFIDFAKGANVLVMHMATDMGNSPLHASPAVVGKVVQSAGVGRLIVSHLGQFDLNAAVAELKKSYTGPLTIGADLQCTPVQ